MSAPLRSVPKPTRKATTSIKTACQCGGTEVYGQEIDGGKRITFYCPSCGFDWVTDRR